MTIIAPDFALVDEKPLSGRQINDMMAIDDGSLYVMQTMEQRPREPGPTAPHRRRTGGAGVVRRGVRPRRRSFGLQSPR